MSAPEYMNRPQLEAEVIRLAAAARWSLSVGLIIGALIGAGVAGTVLMVTTMVSP